MMKAIQILKPAPIEENNLCLNEVEKPIPGDNEVLIKVSCCGVCRTDLHIAEGDIQRAKYPIIPGHQVVGTIESLPKSAKNFKIHDRVGVAWLGHTCTNCEFCLSNRENLCPNSQYTGYDFSGGYAEYIKADINYIYPIPKKFSDEKAAPLLCAGLIGYRAFKRSNAFEGCSLGLIGFGSSAHLVMQLSLYKKCRVHVATRDPKHQALAKEMGAIEVMDGSRPFKEKLHSIILFAPAGELIPKALESLKPGGTLSLAGIHMSDIPTMNYEKHLFHEKNIHSVEANTRLDGQEFLDYAQKANIDPKIEIFSLSEASKALLELKKDQITGSCVLKIGE